MQQQPSQTRGNSGKPPQAQTQPKQSKVKIIVTAGNLNYSLIKEIFSENWESVMKAYLSVLDQSKDKKLTIDSFVQNDFLDLAHPDVKHIFKRCYYLDVYFKVNVISI